MLAKYELPDLGYPVPSESFEMIVSTGDIKFEDMLYWLQDYSSKHPIEWLECEPAILRLSELIAPHEKGPDNLLVEGDDWSLQFGHVDLTQKIVTIQRAGHLIASIQDAGNGRLLVSAYRPLDSKAASYLTSLSLNPAPDGTVCMRANNWEYALDCSVGTGNMYAADSGESYLSYWEFGLGLCRDGSKIEEWYFQRDTQPIVAKFTVMQVGICYEKSDILESNMGSQSLLNETTINIFKSNREDAQMTFTESVKTVLQNSEAPITPQEIREIIKKEYPQFYGTQSHVSNVEKGNYNNLDHALLAQIYNLVKTNESFFCDKNYKPLKVSLMTNDIEPIPSVEDFEEEEGLVYILKTDTYTKEGKEIIKIGFTTQDINKRINQLYTTGVPFKFQIHATYKTRNFIELEMALHKLLDPFKLNKSREFFIEDALPFISDIVALHRKIQCES